MRRLKKCITNLNGNFLKSRVPIDDFARIWMYQKKLLQLVNRILNMQTALEKNAESEHSQQTGQSTIKVDAEWCR